MESTYTKLIVTLPDIGDVEVFVANRFKDIYFADAGIHLGKHFLQARFVGLQIKANVRHWRADALNASHVLILRPRATSARQTVDARSIMIYRMVQTAARNVTIYLGGLDGWDVTCLM